MFRIYASKAASSSGRCRSRAAVVLVTLATTLFASLAASEVAQAHGDWPSRHQASASSCYKLSGSSTWRIMSSVYMNRADGYWPTITNGGYDQLGNYVGTSSGTEFTKQWLYYRVVVGWYDAYGRLQWKAGNWMRRKDALGNHTDGITTEVQMPDGSWRWTQYTIADSIFDVVTRAEDLTAWDVSFASGLGPGWKYVYGQMWWGPIYQTVPGPTALVFDPYTHWEPLAKVYCG